MRRYVSAYGRWPDGRSFPLVMFVTRDEQRSRFVEGVAAKQAERLFTVCTFPQALSTLTQ